MLIHIIIKGRVQGVGFRHFTKETAKNLKLKGWVKNNPDGTVEVMAEGDENVLREFLNYLKEGAPLSYVESVNFEVLDKEGGFKDFEIRY